MTFNIAKKYTEQLKALFVVLLLSTLGYLLNLYPIPLFSEMHLIIGNFAFVIVAMRFGVLYSLLSAMIIASSFVISFGHPFGYILYGAEAVFIALLRQRGWYVLYADMIFWVLIGMPITALVVYFMVDSHQLYTLAIIKQAINGLLYSCFAGMILYFFPKTFAFKFRQQPRFLRPFKVQLVYATSLIILFSVMTITLLLGRSLINNQQLQIEHTIVEQNQYITQAIEQYTSTYKKALSNAAETISLLEDKNDVEQVILTYKENYKDFYQIWISSPETDYRKGTVVIADGSSTVTLTVPLTGKLAQPQLLQANIKLDSLLRFIPHNNWQNIEAVILNAGQVVIATPSLELELNNDLRIVNNPDLNHLVRLGQNDRMNEQKYYYEKSKLSNDWDLYVLLNADEATEILEQEYIYLFAMLGLAFLITIALTERVGLQITKPLRFILKQLDRSEGDRKFNFPPLYENSATEISALYEQLQQRKNELNKYYVNLESEVATRTEELKLANEKLTKLAQKDKLTGLYNRHYFDEQFKLFQKLAFRNNSNLAVVLLDLDHFKEVNDTYGHLTGDRCLKVFSRTLRREFSRSTDLIARFGGEEFIILIHDISETNLAHKLEKLRQNIEQLSFNSENKETYKITVSMGVLHSCASYSGDVNDWIKVADDCLYIAKNSGRNKVEMQILDKS
ncbi:GGDEF domain-containing protein [Thalassotalea crassostreae]|uniref:GGDEF domain-containing protein n=1 Tax=Thalassotalea crassostreae TaxID=1763536 RepID=UPI0008389EBB|nr:GGDEF domain-containing protein [Thalassotalea crassostreae]